MLIPVSGGMAKVTGTRRAMAMVADSPGMAPTRSPRPVPAATAIKLNQVNTEVKPSKMLSKNIIFHQPLYTSNNGSRIPSGMGSFKNHTNRR